MPQQQVTTGSYPLQDALFRNYNPVWGRWLSPDPAGVAAANPMNPQSWNRYAYALNNPAAFVDPLGLDTGCEGDVYKCPDEGIGSCALYEACYNGPAPTIDYLEAQTWQSIDSFITQETATPSMPGDPESTPLPTGTLNYAPNQGYQGGEMNAGFNYIIDRMIQDWVNLTYDEYKTLVELKLEGTNGWTLSTELPDSLNAWEKFSIPSFLSADCGQNAGAVISQWKPELQAWLQQVQAWEAANPGQPLPQWLIAAEPAPPNLSGVCL